MEINSILEEIPREQEHNFQGGSTALSLDEAYKLLGLKKGCTRDQVIKNAANLQKIHPDLNRDQSTERLSQLVNEARDKILKNDFS